MSPSLAPPENLVVHNARLIGGAGREGELRDGLVRLNIGDVMPQSETLLIPYLRATAPLSSGMPTSLFAARLADQLRSLRRDALVDPDCGIPDRRAFRFTSHDRYAAWLVLNWLKPASFKIRQLLVELLNGQSMEQWQRRTILSDGTRIVYLVQALATGNCLALWANRLSDSDCVTAMQALGRAYGFEPSPLPMPIFETRNNPASLGPGPRKSTSLLPVSSRTANGPDALALTNLQRTLMAVAQQVGHSVAQLSQGRQELLLTALVLAKQPGLGAMLGGRAVLSLAQHARAVLDEPTRPTPLIASGNKPSAWLERNRLPEPTEVHVAVSNAVNLPQKPIRSIRPPIIRHANAENARAVRAKQQRIGQIPFPEASAPCASALSQIHTVFGGLMFVINMLLALKLYPDFTMPLGRRLHPSPFWLLAQLGVRLFGRSFRRDPLFRLLNDIGQPGSLPNHWRVERKWLANFSAKGVLYPTFDGTNLTYWDSRGFIFSDSPANPKSRKATHAAVASNRGKFRLPAKRDDRWVACLASFLKFRTNQAAPGLDLSCLRLPAKASLSEDGLDLYFSLAELPLAVRMAGLDRNPGWLPSEGRHIMFHFA